MSCKENDMVLIKVKYILFVMLYPLLLGSCANEQTDQQNTDKTKSGRPVPTKTEAAVRPESKSVASEIPTIVPSETKSLESAKKATTSFKVRVLNDEEYSGVKVGKLFFLEISITNESGSEVTVGDYFRVVMNEKLPSWSIMAMGARGETSLRAKNIVHQGYGSGAASITMAGEKGEGMLIGFPGKSDVINDQSDSHKNVLNNWPDTIASSETIVITWPFFWFSDTISALQYLATPSIGTEKNRSFYWITIETNTVRKINATEKALKKILSDKSESVALRSATVRWLMETNVNSQKYLLQFIQKGDIPVTLSYRCIQALMIWGSKSTIDDVFTLWKKKNIAPEIEENLATYFTWSDHENAGEAAEKIKAGAR